MKAFGFTSNSSDPILVEQAMPKATGNDLLIAIEAIAVNPVDTKVKASINQALASPKIVGWDAVGTVIETGDDVDLFTVGESVFYAGDVGRSGCYASHQLVDQRIVGLAPKSLSAEQAAAMPLTSLTAWEALFSRLKITAERDAGKNILIIGGAGGVGSIAIQLAKKIAKLNVITTASRSESERWCVKQGADHVINHHADLVLQYRSLGLADPDYIVCLNNTDRHFKSMAELIAPQGMICSIVGTQQKHDLDCLKSKSAGFVWEFMFTRPMFKTNDISQQHHILTQVSHLLDKGELNSTLTEIIGPITAENIMLAHNKLVSGNTIGKLVLTAICD
ncbi:MAG: zinc-binding alcohol dehydrogenase family protein [Gammaproteobacteria bacterium]|nr:zinc-binding alcohol dehydrogenase family protein [Gammaproteobacteria bacterium]